ncbi:MAG: hypothetical protein KAR00_01250 [Candidatus Pacebacteria bacterium]|nr:hypothetical protein [Candidatus Paceibacterota bacterium]
MILIKRWIQNWRFAIKDFLSCLGFLWLITEIISYFFSSVSERLNLPLIFWCILGSSFLYAIFKNYPKSSHSIKIRDRDSCIELKIGDAFNVKGSQIVPFNNYFDTSLNGNVKEAKSIQNKLIKDYFNNDSKQLDDKIKEKINIRDTPFEIGKVIEIEKQKKKLFKNKIKRFYLLVNSKKQKNDRVKSSIDDFMLSLNGLWEFLSSDSSKDESIVIPLINAQHGRNPELTREIIIKQIIDTFIDTSKYKAICEKLIIVIHPSDLKKGNLKFDELIKYQLFQCKNYKSIEFNPKPEGKEIEPSEVSKIKN